MRMWVGLRVSNVKSVPNGYWRYPLVLLLIFVTALYVWQVANAWSNQDKVDQSATGVSIQSLDSARNSSAVELWGLGLASGATGTLAYDRSGSRGVLQLHDLPTLPAGRVYDQPVYQRKRPPAAFSGVAFHEGVSAYEMASTDLLVLALGGTGSNKDSMVELRGFEPLTPSMRMWLGGCQVGHIRLDT